MTNRTAHPHRAEILKLAAEVGHAEASRRTGVPSSTIRNWAARATKGARSAIALVEQQRAERAPAPVSVPAPAPIGELVVVAEVMPPAKRQTWGELREPLLIDVGAAAGEALDAVRAAIRLGKARDAQAFAVTFGITVDKANVIAGLPTSTHEERRLVLTVNKSESELAAEVRQLRHELGIGGGDDAA